MIVLALFRSKFSIIFAALWLFLCAATAIVYVRSLRGGRGKLAGFINSSADKVTSWACVGPLSGSFDSYEADCELSDGYYVQIQFLGRRGYFRVFTFMKGPEAVMTAPLIKARLDGKTFKGGRFPLTISRFENWKSSEVSWMRLVATDQQICSWMGNHYYFRKLGSLGDPSGTVRGAAFLCYDIYLRSPRHEGEWWKGKVLCATITFVEPKEQQELTPFYTGMISTAQKIIEHIKESNKPY